MTHLKELTADRDWTSQKADMHMDFFFFFNEKKMTVLAYQERTVSHAFILMMGYVSVVAYLEKWGAVSLSLCQIT